MPLLSWISGGSKKPKSTTTRKEEEAQVPLLANYVIPKPDSLEKPKSEADPATLSSDQNQLISRADHLMLEANRCCYYSKHDDVTAGLYEQAAKLYKVAKKYEKSKEAFLKASERKQFLSEWTSYSGYTPDRAKTLESAAKDMESAATLAKKLGNETEVIDLYTSASQLYRRTSKIYLESAKISEYAAAQEKGMRALKDVAPAVAISLYTDYFDILEDYDDYSISPSIYQEATKIYLKLEKYIDAAALLFRFGSSSRSCDAYLSAIIVYLYAQDLEQADKCYNECCRAKYFLRSEHFFCAGELLNAYKEADADKIIQVVALKDSCIRSLWPRILKLADKLPSNEAKLRASLDLIKV